MRERDPTLSNLVLDILTHTFVAAVPTVAFWRVHRRLHRAKEENRNLRTLASAMGLCMPPVGTEQMVRVAVSEALRSTVPAATRASAKVTIETRSGGSVSFEVRK
jgi:hypothetical protein